MRLLVPRNRLRDIGITLAFRAEEEHGCVLAVTSENATAAPYLIIAAARGQRVVKRPARHG